MSKSKAISGNRQIRVIAEPYEEEKDPKTGKTISRKNSMIMAAGAAIAGAAVNNQMQNMDITEIFLDDTSDNVIDAISSDPGIEGNVETSSLTTEDNSLQEQTSEAWNPKEAPMASPGTIQDDMSFSEAFASAREELGAGGVFAWHGNYYNTFYSEELDDSNQPLVDYQTTDPHELPAIEYQGNPGDDTGTDYATDQDTYDTENLNTGNLGEPEPDILAADLNADGAVDAVFVDINQDGSADAMYADQNMDGQLSEDELIVIHDPAGLMSSDVVSDGTTMSVDLNADGTDEVLIADVNYDQVVDVMGIDENNNQQIEESEVIILNPDAMNNEAVAPDEIEYSGEVSDDIPEDVPDDVLESMEDDLVNLEDNFDEINDWS
ncbi:MAG: hypothetical protein AB9834_11515 [Lentimicrobium sp.]